MITDPRYIMIDDMPFLLKPLETCAFDERDVIYVILSRAPDGTATIIDVGQSPETGAPPFNDPERRATWHRNASGKILVGTHRPASDFNMAEDRLKIIAKLRRI